MENFFVCLNAVAPIFLTLAFGYLARCLKIVRREDVTRINQISFKLFIPIMAFCNIYNSDLGTAANPKLMAFGAIAVILGFSLAALLVTCFEKTVNRRGVMIQGIFRSNFVFIGLPIAKSLLGDVDLGAVAILMAICIPIFNIFSVYILSVNNGEKPDYRKVLKNIATNPLILGTLTGIAAALLKIELPEPVHKVMNQFSDMIGPLMLFLLGAFFEFGGLRHAAKELVFTCLGKLVFLPALALTAAYFLGFRAVEFVALLSLFASPTAVNSFTMAEQMGGDAKLAGNIVVMTSALCSLTLFMWSLVFKALGAW